VLLALLPVPRRTPGHPVVLHAGLAERVGVGGVVGGVGGLVVGGVVVGRGEVGGHDASWSVSGGRGTSRPSSPSLRGRSSCCGTAMPSASQATLVAASGVSPEQTARVYSRFHAFSMAGRSASSAGGLTSPMASARALRMRRTSAL